MLIDRRFTAISHAGLPVRMTQMPRFIFLTTIRNHRVINMKWRALISCIIEEHESAHY